jgi:hypothetical protein
VKSEQTALAESLSHTKGNVYWGKAWLGVVAQLEPDAPGCPGGRHPSKGLERLS